MKRQFILILTLIISFSCSSANFISEPKADFYVSKEGSDSWSGTIDAPNSEGTDGPFATLEKARDAVRVLKKKTSKDIVVLIRDGFYQLNKTIVFDLRDSGEGEFTITYASYPGEKPVFSSGQEITGWTKVTNDLPGLPKVAKGNIMVADVSDKFLTLYDEEGMLPRAQSEGFITEEKTNSRNRLHFPVGTFHNYRNMDDAEIKVRPHHAWITNMLPVESFNAKKQTVTTSIDATYAMNVLHFLKKTENAWVENVLEALDKPGEWVFNSKEGKVYLWPRNESTVYAPQLIEFIRVEGKINEKKAKDIPVRNLHFRGLTFKHGERYTLTPDDAGLQHDWDMFDKSNALVRFRGTENCVIEQSHFLHSGSGAIRVDLYGMNNRISGNHIEYMGGSGILLAGYGPGTKNVNKKNTVYNNHIHHVGEIYWHSPGIFVWQSGENRIANNLIHHINYTAIILSGCMTDFFAKKGNGRELLRTLRRYEMPEFEKGLSLDEVLPYLHTKNNIVEYNEIHNGMQRLGDGNAIYIRGSGKGNHIRYNYIHHMVTDMIMQAAIRTDGGQTGTFITGNLIYKATSQGILTKLDNKVENNIVADIIAPPRGYYLSVREGPLTGGAIKRNIFYSLSESDTFIDELPPGEAGSSEDRRGRALARAMDSDTDYNIYFCKPDVNKGLELLKKNQMNGVDKHSLAIDPMFVDPENGDFSLKPNSPALELGIVPLDLSKVGLRLE